MSSMVDSFEKIPCEIFCQHKAKVQRLWLFRDCQIDPWKACCRPAMCSWVATGSTPISMYAELAMITGRKGLALRTLLLSILIILSYWKDAYQSYWSFMHRHLFDHVDIDPSNIHLPNGELPKDKNKRSCAAYEPNDWRGAGSIDLQILSIGNNSHIGFNEPGFQYLSKTRIVNLDVSTRNANAREFQNLAKVPRLAVTMGISTIMKAKRICWWHGALKPRSLRQ